MNVVAAHMSLVFVRFRSPLQLVGQTATAALSMRAWKRADRFAPTYFFMFPRVGATLEVVPGA
jgi:hypothetical protein